MSRFTRKLMASLALVAMLGAHALPLFAQDKPAEKPADAAAPAAAAPAAGAAPAAPATPKCGDKGFDCNKGDVSWMMTSSAFVLLMTVPGLALFYAGMARTRNALSTVMQSFSIFCRIAVQPVSRKVASRLGLSPSGILMLKSPPSGSDRNSSTTSSL